jgi:hypothetical protein
MLLLLQARNVRACDPCPCSLCPCPSFLWRLWLRLRLRVWVLVKVQIGRLKPFEGRFARKSNTKFTNESKGSSPMAHLQNMSQIVLWLAIAKHEHRDGFAHP